MSEVPLYMGRIPRRSSHDRETRYSVGPYALFGVWGSDARPRHFHFPKRVLAPCSSGLFPEAAYRGTSLIRKRPSLGPYCSPMPRALWWS